MSEIDKRPQLDAAMVLIQGPMAWLEQLDVLYCESGRPTPDTPEGRIAIYREMLELERTGAWYDPERYVLVMPTVRSPALWSLLYQGRRGSWRKVRAEVDRW